MPLKLVIKDNSNEYLEYSIEQLVSDFVDALPRASLYLLKKNKKAAYCLVFEKLVREFKEKTRYLKAG